MVTALKVTNYLGETLSINPFDPESSGFLILNITGLTPVKGDINFTSITTNDGALYNSARIDTRNIVLTLLYYPSPTIESTRLKSYKYFPVKKPITLEFQTENRKAEITGYVESNEMSIFTSAEYSTISILCPDPYFYSTSENTDIDVKFSGILPAFRFITPTYSEAAPNIIFGKMKTVNEKIVKYSGDSEIGMEIIIRATGSVGDITIYNRITQESMMISSSKLASLTGSGLITGDVITIYTYRGNKKIELLRAGNTFNILNCLGKNATWLMLRKGNNTLAYAAPIGGLNVQLEIKSKTIYEGL